MPDNIKTSFQKKGIKLLEFSVPADEPLFTDHLDEWVFDFAFKGSIFRFLNTLSKMCFSHCKWMMSDETFLNNVASLKINIAIVDSFFPAQCMFLLPHHLGLPYVVEYGSLDSVLYRIPALPSFQPHFLIPYDDDMTFLQRVHNTFQHIIMGSLDTTYFDDAKLIEKYAPGKTYTDLARKALLVIVPKDHVMEDPMVTMPNVVLVPGISQRPSGKLDPPFETIVNQDEHGVIVVSFGSSVSKFPTEIIQKFIEGFRLLKQTVIWKFASKKDLIKGGIPKNVHLSKWLPQNDLLGHNKTKLFITHCGNNGRHEALYHGVPVLAFPLFADQYHGAHMLEVKQLGKKLDIKTFTPDMLKDAINEILNGDKYKKSVKKAQQLMKARPMSPNETTAYWIEHVIKFGGDHLRSHAMDMPWYAFYMVDILVFLVVIFCTAIFALYYVAKIVSRKVFKRKTD